jgi:transcriptional regulator with XRE-family HTH domain
MALEFKGDPRRAFVFDGSRLRQRRRSAGLTVSQLAAAVGRCTASIVHYQSGLTVPPTAALLRVCEVLDCHPAELFVRVEDTQDNVLSRKKDAAMT